MLTLLRGRVEDDGVPRRNFLKIGSLGIGGLMLSDLMRLEAQAPARATGKSLITVFLGGGPSHQDMWDLKPDAPSEYRGEFNPVSTNVPGVQICELFPKLARMAERYTIVRGMVGSVDEHSTSTSMTGYSENNLRAVGGRPSIGSVLAWRRRADEREAPTYVSLMGRVTPGYLGPVYQPYTPDGAGRSNLKLERIDADRLRSRTELLGALDTLRRDVDAGGDMKALDSFSQRALEVVTSGRMAQALDWEKEPKETIRRYVGDGRDSFDGNRNFLLARRLVEAGVRCVALSWGGWDTHEGNFKSLRKQLPALDTGLAALLDDLSDRSMLGDVTIVVWGEFGRTPQVNNGAGRDHWPRVSAAFLAGGGLKCGQVVGSSDRLAGEAVEPIHVHQVHATLYHALGIDVEKTQIVDPAGRPQYLLDHRTPIRALV